MKGRAWPRTREDPASAFAVDFLNQLMDDAVPPEQRQPARGLATFADGQTPLPSTAASVEGLLALEGDRFDQLLRTLTEAEDVQGLQALQALLQGEAQRGSASAQAGAAGGVANPVALAYLDRANRIGTSLAGLGSPGGFQALDPTDPTSAPLPGRHIDPPDLRDLVNTLPADWQDWGQSVLVRLGMTAEELRRYLPSLTLPGVVVVAADLVIEPNTRVLQGNLGAPPAPTGYRPHHIVPVEDTRAAEIRALLRLYEIDLDSANNGIWLPENASVEGTRVRTPHDETYRASYFTYLRREFAGVDSRESAIDALARVKASLNSGQEFERAVSRP